MAFADQLVAIGVHLAAAGNALANPIKDVANAHPVPNGRCIRYFYAGEGAPERMGANRVLNGELVAERVMVVAFWPLSNLGTVETSVIDTEAYNLKHEIKTRIFGDSQLGGQATDLAMGYAATDFLIVNGTLFRTLELEIITDFIEYALAP